MSSARNLLALLEEHGGPAETVAAVEALCAEHRLPLPPRVTLTADGAPVPCSFGFGPFQAKL
eukprot:SAG22_NODE_17171_length_310_cov_0.872038_1_plen_61_part_10